LHEVGLLWFTVCLPWRHLVAFAKKCMSCYVSEVVRYWAYFTKIETFDIVFKTFTIFCVVIQLQFTYKLFSRSVFAASQLNSRLWPTRSFEVILTELRRPKRKEVSNKRSNERIKSVYILSGRRLICSYKTILGLHISEHAYNRIVLSGRRKIKDPVINFHRGTTQVVQCA